MFKVSAGLASIEHPAANVEPKQYAVATFLGTVRADIDLPDICGHLFLSVLS
jgi:hypothetical protein